jgi:hypothetical protein
MKSTTHFKELPLAARCTIVMFGVLGLAAAVYTTVFQTSFAPGRILLLMALAAAGARIKVNLFKGATLSFLTSVVLWAVIQEGPAVAILAGICGVTVQAFSPSKKLVLHQLAFNAGMIALTVTASWFTHPLLVGAHTATAVPTDMTATLLASFTYFLGNSLSVSLIIGLTKGMSVFQTWFQHFLFSAPSFLIAGMLAVGVLTVVTTQSLIIVAALLMVISLAYYCSVRMTALAAR